MRWHYANYLQWALQPLDRTLRKADRFLLEEPLEPVLMRLKIYETTDVSNRFHWPKLGNIWVGEDSNLEYKMRRFRLAIWC